jgi:hypothetical protein
MSSKGCEEFLRIGQIDRGHIIGTIKENIGKESRTFHTKEW